MKGVREEKPCFRAPKEVCLQESQAVYEKLYFGEGTRLSVLGKREFIRMGKGFMYMLSDLTAITTTLQDGTV